MGVTPRIHRLWSIVIIFVSFAGGTGAAVWLVGLGNGYRDLVPIGAGILAAIAGEEVWRRLVPARCPACGVRCRLVVAPAGWHRGGEPRWVTRYTCPACKYRL
jgi:anaerobic selenocysteine-containing dehydrogenase